MDRDHQIKPELDHWMEAARAQLGKEAHPAAIAALLFAKIEALRGPASKTRELLYRSALQRAASSSGTVA